ncbi:MAG: hypothetical protein US50_C0004G0019 [Candidatus Nomurabacteria bacterium GW2011_GWB1_37_5]|uniref:Lipoprotein n=1 Tax=Candidatus Nomurabacteria bacterium GW2011_GWB1_37_5 TaxID=1618742 RepID=A0A0G0HBC6_9BACT|nr:MAG: hypothetical protein US50_C0004G0019 [Candidatus Nomurabacteria bacterium GW2011_GWB1_37_5]
MKNLTKIILVSFTAITLTSCFRERTDLYFGEQGLSCKIKNPSFFLMFGGNYCDKDIELSNHGKKQYHAIIERYYLNQEWWNPELTDSSKYEELVINPKDVFCFKNSNVVELWKDTDACGHRIPFSQMERVGWFDKDGNFTKSDYLQYY